ncbi:MAG: thioesterase family protein [Myxococcota bacterium]
MSEPFSVEFRARWADMDFNQHMRNAAYLGCGEETRVRFMDAHGFPISELQRRRLGPVVLEDKLTYRRELTLLEPFRVDLAVAGASEDGRKLRLRNRFFRASDGELVATVESLVLWFDLEKRKPVAPPDDLRAVWAQLARAEDFAVIA